MAKLGVARISLGGHLSRAAYAVARRAALAVQEALGLAAAAVDEHHWPPTRDGGHVREHVRLLRDRRPPQFDDEDLAHQVVYSLFSMT